MLDRLHKVLLLVAVIAGFWLVRRAELFLHRRRLIKLYGCKKPVSLPQREPFLGLDTLVESYTNIKNTSYLSASKARFDQYGSTFAFDQLGKRVINTIEPENIKAVLATKFADFGVGSRRAAAFTPLIGHGIFVADGPEWESARKIIRPSFARSEMTDLSMFDEHVERLLENIPRDGSDIDLQELFLRFTIDTATDFLFGRSTLSLAPEKVQDPACDFAGAFNRAQRSIADFFALGSLAIFAPKTQFKKDQKVVHGFADEFVEKALSIQKASRGKAAGKRDSEPKPARYCFIDEFAKATQDPKLLRGGLLNVLLAGRDTTASLLSNLWFVLAREPEIWNKLQAEIAPLGGNKPTLGDIKEMKYLRNCINESLRLHPVIPINSRTAIRDTILPRGGGVDGNSPIFVAAGTQVGYQCYAMHRRTDIYGLDANEFNPDRWETIRPGWAYLPFNGGPRICLGQQFAINEASFVTIRLLQEFCDLEGRDDEPWQEGLTLSCASKNGVVVGLTPTPSVTPCSSSEDLIADNSNSDDSDGSMRSEQLTQVSTPATELSQSIEGLLPPLPTKPTRPGPTRMHMSRGKSFQSDGGVLKGTFILTPRLRLPQEEQQQSCYFTGPARHESTLYDAAVQ